VSVTIDHASLSAVLDTQLEPDGHWDGREVGRLTRRLLVRPLRAALTRGDARGGVDARFEPGGELRIEARR
jgi:hypothetical protein